MQEILDGYAAAATQPFIAAYESLSSEAIYEHVIDLLPSCITRVADIGAGTGRDAAWFTKKGHRVFAVEPVRELREAGEVIHAERHITWVDDQLPHLTKLLTYGCFGFAVLCGVWHHITEEERLLAMPNISRLLGMNGRLVMSLRHGPGPEGRRVFPVDADATVKDAEKHGLRAMRRHEASSIQTWNQSMGVSWTWLVFEKVC